MRAYEFSTKLKSDGKLELPDTISKLIPSGHLLAKQLMQKN